MDYIYEKDGKWEIGDAANGRDAREVKFTKDAKPYLSRPTLFEALFTTACTPHISLFEENAINIIDVSILKVIP